MIPEHVIEAEAARHIERIEAIFGRLLTEEEKRIAEACYTVGHASGIARSMSIVEGLRRED